MKDRIDKILYEKSKDNIEIPKILPDMIIKTIDEQCFKEEKIIKLDDNKYKTFYKLATGICACILLTSTVVFAQEIIETIFKLSKEIYGQKQLQSAIEENYIQANDSNQYMKDKNGVLYKFNHVLLNDINLILSLNFVFKEELNEYQGITFNGLVITDENNNQIYIDDGNQSVWQNNIATLMTHYTVEKNKNDLEESIVLISPQFPNIEKLYISFDSIILYNVVDGEPETKIIEGDYEIEIPVDNKFNNRDVISYEIIENDSEELNIEEIKLTNTGLGIVVNGKDIEGMGYQIKLYNEKNEEIYSKLNKTSFFGSTTKYFIWIDINETFKKEDILIIEIIDINQNKHIFKIKKT